MPNRGTHGPFEMKGWIYPGHPLPALTGPASRG
jgi:hypothetical protein